VPQKGQPLDVRKLEFQFLKDAPYQICLKRFQRNGRTERQRTDDGREVITIAHVRLRAGELIKNLIEQHIFSKQLHFASIENI